MNSVARDQPSFFCSHHKGSAIMALNPTNGPSFEVFVNVGDCSTNWYDRQVMSRCIMSTFLLFFLEHNMLFHTFSSTTVLNCLPINSDGDGIFGPKGVERYSSEAICHDVLPAKHCFIRDLTVLTACSSGLLEW